jgi:hypothetical protein
VIERVEPDVQRDARPVDAPGCERGEKLIREVEARRRGGRGAALPGKHGLIPVEITLCFLTAADVARQRHPAHLLEDLRRRSGGIGHGKPCAAAGAADQLEREGIMAGAVDEDHALTDRGPAARVGENSPDAPLRLGLQEKTLPLSTRGRPAADEPRGDDPRVVDDDEVARFQQVGQVADVPMGERAVAPPHDEQPRGIPAIEGLLRDQFRWQFVVVEVGVGHPQIVSQNAAATRCVKTVACRPASTPASCPPKSCRSSR